MTRKTKRGYKKGKNVMSKNNFDACIEEWKNMDRTTPNAIKDALAFYDERVFPFVKEEFINKPENRPNRAYDGLILTVGMSPEPLILSILAIGSKRVGLLYTEETEHFLERIQQETGLTIAQFANGVHKIDGSNVSEIYEAIMTLYKRWDNPAHIAVDITGGKKSMVSGAAMAGAVLGADIYYVDSDHFNRELGKPEPGTEYLSLLDDPYTVFGDMETEKAKSLYKGHDYAGAQRIFSHLRTQVGDPEKTTVYEAYGYLCEIYEAWDNLNTGKASNILNRQLLPLLNQYSTLTGLQSFYNLRSSLDKQARAVECVRNCINAQQRALENPGGFHLAFTLYHKALRLAEQEKFDIACLILYRLLEWIGQHRLAKYDIDTREPDYSKSKCDETQLLARYQEKRKEVYGSTDRSDLPASTITLVDGFLVLHALEDDIVCDLDWGKFRNQIETRNQSIYVHGWSVIDNRRFEAFKKTALELFRKAQKLADINADTFEEQHKFIVP